MSFLTICCLFITCISPIVCALHPKPLTEQDMKDIINKNNNHFRMDNYELKLSKTGLLGLTKHSIVWAGKLNNKTPVAIKIIWDKEFSVQEKKILGVLDAKNPKIEEKGIPRIYYIGPFQDQYDAIVMTLFDGDLDGRWKKQKRISDISLLMIFKRSLEILKYLSQRNVVHNDIKPGNIFFKGPEVFISDFDISTVGDERTTRATLFFASLNYFKNPDNPERSFKDDLESLVYTMWSVAGIIPDRYEGRSGSMDARQPEGFTLFNSLAKGGAAAQLISKCLQLPPALIDVFQDVCLKEIMSQEKVPRYDRIIKLVDNAIVKANNGSARPLQFEWLGKQDNHSFFSKLIGSCGNLDNVKH